MTLRQNAKITIKVLKYKYDSYKIAQQIRSLKKPAI